MIFIVLSGKFSGFAVTFMFAFQVFPFIQIPGRNPGFSGDLFRQSVILIPFFKIVLNHNLPAITII